MLVSSISPPVLPVVLYNGTPRWHADQRAAGLMQTMLSERIREWEKAHMRQGLQEGLEQGRLEGEAALRLRLITHRFGEPSEAIQAQLNGATRAELERWANRILDVDTLEALFK